MKHKIISWLGGNRKELFTIVFVFLFAVMLGNTLNEPKIHVPMNIEGCCCENVTYNELVGFMLGDNVSKNTYGDDYNCYNFTIDTMQHAMDEGICSAYVVVPPDEGGDINHAIIGFNAIGCGMVYFEPQNDRRVFPEEVLYTQWC